VGPIVGRHWTDDTQAFGILDRRRCGTPFTPKSTMPASGPPPALNVRAAGTVTCLALQLPVTKRGPCGSSGRACLVRNIPVTEDRRDIPSRSRLPADSMPRYRLATPRLRSLSLCKTLSSHQEKRDCDYLD